MQARLLFMALTLMRVRGQMVFPDDRIQFGKPGFVLVNENQSYQTPEVPTGNLLANSIYNNLWRKNNGVYRGMNNFAMNLNKAILNQMYGTPTENIVMSPLSIAGALSLLVLGSVGNTYDELANALGFFNDISKSEYVHREFGNLLNKITKRPLSGYNDNSQNLTYASAAFLQNDYTLNKNYDDQIRSIYKSYIMKVDFKDEPENAKTVINRWVKDMTNGKIENILQFIPPTDTKIILASVLYFQAEWQTYFIDGLTKRQTFTPDKRYPNENFEVVMMGNVGLFPYFKSKEHDCMIVGLPYKDNRTTLYAIKPVDSTKKPLKQLLNELTGEVLESLIKSTIRQETIVLFPKMKLTSTYSLKAFLEDMGIHDVFSKTAANLGRISGSIKRPEWSLETDENEDRLIFTRFGDNKSKSSKIKEDHEYTNPGLYVDEVIHKVDIDINETGTVAAASTVVIIKRSGRRPVFVADEPFFFIIRDEETGLMLFSSVVYKPTPNF